MKKYLIELTMLQRMLVSGMKAKQSTEPSVDDQLTELLSKLKKSYFE